MTPPRIAVVSAVGLCLALAFAVDRVARRSTRLRLPSRITIENVVADLSGTLEEASGRAVSVVERLKIADALRRTDSRVAAAELLGISARTLAAKMKELGIDE